MNKQELLKKAEGVLSERELQYFRMMFAQKLTLFLKGRPGTWKSAIFFSIAKKLGMVYVDLRLPTMDETDLGTFPVIRDEKVGDRIMPVLRSAIPEWAAMTKDMSRFFLINFEELNRAPLAVRNAALGVLNEKRIGAFFQFGENVFMCSTGNIGTADGTDVEEFDTALKSRLIPVTHDAELSEWMENFAKTVTDKDGKTVREGEIHNDIVEFLNAKAEQFYPPMTLQGGTSDVITNPRTWEGLSKTIEANFGRNAPSNLYRDFLIKCGQNYVGAHALEFLKFIDENVTVTLDDVLSGKVKDYSKIKRDNKAAILRTFEQYDVNKAKDPEYKRLVAFLRTVEQDLLTGALLQYSYARLVALQGTQKEGKRASEFVKEFKKEFDYVLKRDTEANEEANKSEVK